MARLKSPGLVIFALSLLALAATPSRAQDAASKYRLKGWYVRGGLMSFNKALILNWDERNELMVEQSKGMPAFGVGYALLPRNSKLGLSVNAQYAKTSLEPFRMTKFTDTGLPAASSPTLQYSAVDYSFLVFDLDAYVVPAKQLPFALTLGVTMDGGFQGYTVSGDNDPVQNANGEKSMNIFRYGYILGCKIIPTKFLSIDLQFRPMAGYSSTTHYTHFLYTKDGWNYYGSANTTEGPSERMTAVAVSIHF